MTGWRARIGVVGAAESLTEGAFNRYAPDGVEICTTRFSTGGTTVAGYANSVEAAVSAANIFERFPKDIILLACTAASCAGGFGWDQQCIQKLEAATHCPATTAITAVVDALRALNSKKIAMWTPYSEEVTLTEKAFLEQSGIAVSSVKMIDAKRFGGAMDGGCVYRSVREMELTGVDTIFISCMAVDTMGIIEPLEADLGLPVITSNQASLWSVLQKCGVREPIMGIGRLLQ